MCHNLSYTHNIVRTCSLCPVSLCPNIHWQVWDIPTHSAYLLCPCIFPTPTALCVCLKTPINKSETHNTNTCSLCAMSLCPNTHQPVWDTPTHSTCSLCPMCHDISNTYITVCVCLQTPINQCETHQHIAPDHFVLPLTISPTPTALSVCLQTPINQCETYKHIAPAHFVPSVTMFPTSTALCVCLLTPINKCETHDTSTQHFFTVPSVTTSYQHS